MDTFLYIAQGAFEQGLIYSFMVMGLYVSYKILNVADLTVDSSFTLGAAVSAVFTAMGLPWLGLLAGMLAGVLAGLVTGVLQTKLRIQPILAGILTMTGLYSVNLIIMGKSNIPLPARQTRTRCFPFAGKNQQGSSAYYAYGGGSGRACMVFPHAGGNVRAGNGRQ